MTPAALPNLQDSASLVTGNQRSRMQKLSSIYKDMFHALHGDGVYDWLQQTCYTSEIPEDMRKGLIAGLPKSVELEREARVIVEDILGNKLM